MTDDLAETYDLPDDFNLARADHMERVEADCGVTLCVLESSLTGERQLVHADVVEFDGYIDHPMTTGAVGFLSVLAAFLAPLAAAAHVASTTSSPMVAIGGALVGVIGAWGLANVVLYQTVMGDWLWRFLEWHDHKHIIMSRGESA